MVNEQLRQSLLAMRVEDRTVRQELIDPCPEENKAFVLRGRYTHTHPFAGCMVLE